MAGQRRPLLAKYQPRIRPKPMSTGSPYRYRTNGNPAPSRRAASICRWSMSRGWPRRGGAESSVARCGLLAAAQVKRTWPGICKPIEALAVVQSKVSEKAWTMRRHVGSCNAHAPTNLSNEPDSSVSALLRRIFGDHRARADGSRSLLHGWHGFTFVGRRDLAVGALCRGGCRF